MIGCTFTPNSFTKVSNKNYVTLYGNDNGYCMVLKWPKYRQVWFSNVNTSKRRAKIS